jgi:hypothetical protein
LYFVQIQVGVYGTSPTVTRKLSVSLCIFSCATSSRYGELSEEDKLAVSRARRVPAFLISTTFAEQLLQF